MTSSSRRQLFRRSKAGCLNCRTKKKKCDEARPQCTRCVRAGEGCRYPSESGNSPEPSNSSLQYVSPSLPSVSSFNSLSILQPGPTIPRIPPAAGASRSLPVEQHHPHQQHSQHRHSHSHSHSRSSIPSTWDDIAQQHPSKRGRYDEMSSPSASSRSSSANYQDHYGRPQPPHPEPFDRLPSSTSFESSRRYRDSLHPTLPPLNSVPMTASASMPSLDSSRYRAPLPYASPNASTYSGNKSPHLGRESNYHSGTVTAATTTTASSTVSLDSHFALSTPLTGRRVTIADSAKDHDAGHHLPPSQDAVVGKGKLILDYDANDLNPHELLQNLDFVSVTTVTQVTPGAKAFFAFLHDVAKLSQGQAMAHALAAMTAIHQANFSKANHGHLDSHPSMTALAPGAAQPLGPEPRHKEQHSLTEIGSSTHHSTMLDLADRHLLAAVKALQNQQTPSRRRRFSIIDAKATTDDLPIGSNAGVMILLILSCNLAGKSLMLPSYLEQCEQFLADAIENMSSHHMFPSVTGEVLQGTPESPPRFTPQSLTHAGLLLITATYVGLFEICVAQYVAVTDWDYDPRRLRRLQPYNWAESDAEAFEATRCSVAETTYSVSMVTMELVIDTMDSVRKLKKAESLARNQRSGTQSDAEDSITVLDSLALRQELGLLIKDLEAGVFWKGAARIFTPAEELEIIAYLDALASHVPTSDTTAITQDSTHVEGSSISASAGTHEDGSLFISSTSGTGKRVNRIRLGNHLFRNALITDLYISVFNLDPSTEIIQTLVSSSLRLLEAVPEMLELGLMWPILVLGSHALDEGEQRSKVRTFLKRSQWKGSAGPCTAQDVLERVWSGKSTSWRQGVKYFGNPLIT